MNGSTPERLATTEQRLDGHDREIREMKRRVSSVESAISDIKDDIHESRLSGERREFLQEKTLARLQWLIGIVVAGGLLAFTDMHWTEVVGMLK